jgi:DNA-binding transcriptional ArsR family regulator
VGTREARVLSNPLRVKILGTITSRPATTEELALEIGASIAAVGYHARVLCKAGCIRAAEEVVSDSVTDRLYEADC